MLPALRRKHSVDSAFASSCAALDACSLYTTHRLLSKVSTLRRTSLHSLSPSNACFLSKCLSERALPSLSPLSFQGDMPFCGDVASQDPAAILVGIGNLHVPCASNTKATLEGTPATSPVEGSQWPRPLSPIAGEDARKIELERALVAEAAMNSSVAAYTTEDILYEDEWLLALNKPAGIYSGHVLASVLSMVRTELDQTGASASQPHVHLANRLDRDTSGVMIVTKCRKTAGKLTRMFENRKVKKTYIALCIGPRPIWDEIIVESGHGRSRWGAWRVYAKEDVGKELPDKAVVKDMATQFSILSVNGEIASGRGNIEQPCERKLAMKDQTYQNAPSFGDELLIKAHPFTGRTHQIRLHCQFLGLPILGDVKYGGPLVWNGIAHNTHALHAESISFRHPITAVDMSLCAPLPKWAAF